MAKEEVKTKLVTKSGKTVIVDSDSLTNASEQEKGVVLQGGGAAKIPWTTAFYAARHPETYRINDVIQGLRDSGTLANDKFIVVYDLNLTDEQFEDDSYGRSVLDYNIYEAGDTAEVYWEDPSDKKGVPYLSGYVFKGWATTPNAAIPTYPYDENDQQTYTLTFTDSDIVLYAVWEKVTYTLTYALGDYGTGSVPSAQTIAEGVEANVAFSPAPTVNDGSGRVFIGWSTEDGGDEYNDATYRQDGYNTITIYSDITLYPVFAAQYTITYALGNDATGSVPSAETFINGQNANINFNPSVTCISDNTKVFVGWSETDKDSSATYTADGTSSIYMNRNVTLYPVFASQGQSYAITVVNNSSYDITVDGNAGEVTISAGQTGSYNYTEEDEVHFDVESDGEGQIDAVYDGTYNGISYSNATLSIIGTQIRNPENTYFRWEFLEGEEGTVTITDIQH